MARCRSIRAEASRPGKHRRRGFTLVEMLAVLAIVGILAAAAQPLLQWTRLRQQETELRQALRQIRGALDAYHAAVRQGRIAAPEAGNGYPPSLRALVDGVPDLQIPGKRHYFLRRLPRDPYADPALPAEASWRLRAYDSPPEAPAPGRDVFDIASHSRATALDGSRHADW